MPALLKCSIVLLGLLQMITDANSANVQVMCDFYFVLMCKFALFQCRFALTLKRSFNWLCQQHWIDLNTLWTSVSYQFYKNQLAFNFLHSYSVLRILQFCKRYDLRFWLSLSGFVWFAKQIEYLPLLSRRKTWIYNGILRWTSNITELIYIQNENFRNIGFSYYANFNQATAWPMPS